jgi:hypothetical protein
VIYVLSGSRRETAQWAKKQGIPLRTARHVYDAQTLPARTGKNRIVELPGFASARNRFAILARLKHSKGLAVEKIDPDEPFALVLMPRDDLAEAAEAMGAEFVDLTDEDDEPQSNTTVAAFDGSKSDDTLVIAEILPSGPVEENGTPEEPNVIDSPEALEDFLGLIEKPVEEPSEETPTVEPEPEPEQEAPAAEPEPESEDSKPKRTRRTKVQMAYDAALADWESNGGSLEAVIEARDALAAKHPEDERLLTAPQSDAEVEAQAEDDDALDF